MCCTYKHKNQFVLLLLSTVFYFLNFFILPSLSFSVYLFSIYTYILYIYLILLLCSCIYVYIFLLVFFPRRATYYNGVDKQLRPRIPIGFDRRLSGRDGHRVVIVAHTATDPVLFPAPPPPPHHSSGTPTRQCHRHIGYTLTRVYILL